MKARPLFLSLALAAGVLTLAGPVAADVLLVERVQTEPPALPDRGLSMAQVEATYGAPERKHAPVAGPNSHQFNPPITRWDYAGFSVYFERNKVVDAVAAKSRPTELGPKPVQ